MGKSQCNFCPLLPLFLLTHSHTLLKPEPEAAGVLGLSVGLAGWGLSAGACPTLPCYPLCQGKQVRRPTPR